MVADEHLIKLRNGINALIEDVEKLRPFANDNSRFDLDAFIKTLASVEEDVSECKNLYLNTTFS
jgi:hypothetical protein